jgi:hypothetical protein
MTVIYKPDRSARLRKPASGSTVFDHAKTGNHLTKLKTAMDSVIRTAADQTIGLNRTATPSIRGIAENRRIVSAAIAAANVLDALKLANDSAQSQDPDLSAYAKELLSDKRFLALLSQSLSGLSESISSIVESRKQPASENLNAPENTPDETGKLPDGNWPKVSNSQQGPDYENVGPKDANHKDDPTRSGIANDAATYGPGCYTVEHLGRDLAARAMAPNFLAQRNPRGGMDAALSEVAKLEFFPDWSSNCWTPEARKAFRDKASFDGGLIAILARHGDSPTYQSEYNAMRVSIFADYFNSEVEPKATPHPRSFDR